MDAGKRATKVPASVAGRASTLLARLRAAFLSCAAGVRLRLSASEKYIIGFKDSSTKIE
jgi:hypothetical protein